MAHEIFISYSRHDKDFVHPFVQQISEAIGKKDCCWIDLKGIESGEEFEDIIIQAIDDCKVVLFMLSNSSLKSKWTKREVYYADGEDKRIVPILIDGQRLRGWFKFHFGNVDFIDIHSEEQKTKLMDNLRKWLEVEDEEEYETDNDKSGSMNPEDAILALAKSTGIDADTIRNFLRKTTKSPYTIYQNAKDELMIMIHTNNTPPVNPWLFYDGGPVALLYRSTDSAIAIKNIAENARPALSNASEVLVVETDNEEVKREYMVPVKIVESVEGLYTED